MSTNGNAWQIVINGKALDKDTKESTCFIDIKFEGLRDVLRIVLEGVNGTSLKEEIPTVFRRSGTVDHGLMSKQIEQRLLYHYVPELDAHARAENDNLVQRHLSLLVDHIKRSCILIRNRIRSLVVKNGEIIFDLFWALFKPNDIVYRQCFGIEKRRCILFDFSEVKQLNNSTEYFHL